MMVIWHVLIPFTFKLLMYCSIYYSRYVLQVYDCTFTILRNIVVSVMFSSAMICLHIFFLVSLSTALMLRRSACRTVTDMEAVSLLARSKDWTFNKPSITKLNLKNKSGCFSSNVYHNHTMICLIKFITWIQCYQNFCDVGSCSLNCLSSKSKAPENISSLTLTLSWWIA